ncbi:MAG TPA: hypothetical protein VMC43_02875, partial [Candidatus Paceibacterota bacterium]|nr:hypothetical protein [Candidatus Paceibacterota bacterium]
MEWIAFVMGLGVALALLVATALVGRDFWLKLLLTPLAKADFFFTMVEEARAKAILVNDRFDRFVMAYKGFGFDDNWNVGEVDKDNPDGGTYQERRKSIDKHLPGGIRWLGLPGVSTVHKYHFRWATVFDTGDKATGELKRHVEPYDEQIDYILLNDYNYYTKLTGAETYEGGKASENGKAEEAPGFGVDVEILLPTRIMNPYLALFRAHRWLEQVQELVKS